MMNNISKIAGIAFLALLVSCSGDEKAAETVADKGSSQVAPSDNARQPVDENQADLTETFAKQETPGSEHEDHGSREISKEPVPDGDGEVDSYDSSDDESYAGDSYEEPVYTVVMSSEPSTGVIHWEAPEGIAYSSAQVVVFNDAGDRVSRNFGAGESIELHGQLPDGAYGWETIISPEVSPHVREQMREVRAKGDQRAEQELLQQLRAEGSLPSEKQARENVQSGSFIVQDGVVRPNYVDQPGADSKDQG